MIVITGANGFLGSVLIKKLTSSLSHHVVQLIYGQAVQMSTDVWYADLTRFDHLKQLIKHTKAPDIIIHLAGYINIALQQNPQGTMLPPVPGDEHIAQLYAVNVGATAHLLEYCRAKNVKKLIFASSQTVYGMPSGILTEDSLCKPLEHYAASKLCAERMLELARKQGLDVTIARFPGLYSEQRTSGIVYQFCKSALYEKKIVVTCNFPLPLDVIHVDDAADALVKMIDSNCQDYVRFNIATGYPCSLDILADRIAALVLECRVEHSIVTQPVVTMNSTLAQNILGWHPQPPEYRLKNMLESISYERFNSSYSNC